ncbi:MAG: NTP transferase domain-containing protein [Clostridia bacterium]|nr:NTP transferase domain-containing protein [Clostridia bacterium]
MIGVILAAGMGTRFNNTAEEKCCKVIKNIADAPLISYALDNLASLGIERVCIVVGEYAAQIRSVAGDIYKGMKITYARQNDQIGIVNALMCAIKTMEQGDDIVLQLADEILIRFNYNLIRREMMNPEYDFFCGFTPENNDDIIKKNYSIELEGAKLKHCTEKPAVVNNKKKGTGFCFFRKIAVDYLTNIYNEQANTPNNLCDYINCLLSGGLNGTAVCVADKEFNINTLSDLIEAEYYL